MFRRTRRFQAIFLMLALSGVPAVAQETSEGAGPAVSQEELTAAVLAHIEEQTMKYGQFFVYDEQEKTPLHLEFQEFVADRGGPVGDQTYFASTRCTDPDGNVVVVDVFMRSTDAGHLKLVKVSVQERDGRERYHWMQEDGLWKSSDGDV